MNKANARALKRILASKDVRASLKSYLHTVAPMKREKKPSQLERTGKRAQRLEATGILREKVFARAVGVCEFCSLQPPSELHHLLGGSGRRQQQQSVENCVAICGWCHRLWHKRPADFAGVVAGWCKRWCYPPIKRIEHAAMQRPNKTTGAASGRRPEQRMERAGSSLIRVHSSKP